MNENFKFLENKEAWAIWVQGKFLLVDQPKEYPCFAFVYEKYNAAYDPEESPLEETIYLYKEDAVQMIAQFVILDCPVSAGQ